MTGTSTIPGAWDGLVTLATGALGDVTVIDGPPLSWDSLQAPADAVSENRFLFVGASPDGDGATAEQAFNAAGNVSRDERGFVVCTVYVTDGNADVATRRRDAFTILASLETGLKTDRTMAGAVLYATVAAVRSAVVRQTAQGSDCTAVFEVAFRSYLS